MSNGRKSVAALRDELRIPTQSPAAAASSTPSRSPNTEAPRPLEHPGKSRPKPPGKAPAGRAGNLHELMRAAAAAEEDRASPSPPSAAPKTARARRASLDDAKPRRARSSSPRRKKTAHKGGARKVKKRTGSSRPALSEHPDPTTPPTSIVDLAHAHANKSDEDEEEEDSSSGGGGEARLKASPAAVLSSSDSQSATASPSTPDDQALRKVRKRVPKANAKKKSAGHSKQLLEDARRHEAAANKRAEDEKRLRLVSDKLLSTMLARQTDKAMEIAVTRWREAEEANMQLRAELDACRAELAKATKH